MPQGAFLHVQLDRLTLVAGQVADVADALDAAVADAERLDAMADGNAGFASAAAASELVAAWLAELRRLGGGVAAARCHITDSVSTYELTDAAAGALFTALG